MTGSICGAPVRPERVLLPIVDAENTHMQDRVPCPGERFVRKVSPVATLAFGFVAGADLPGRLVQLPVPWQSEARPGRSAGVSWRRTVRVLRAIVVSAVG